MDTQIKLSRRQSLEDIYFELVALLILAIPCIEILTRLAMFFMPNSGLVIGIALPDLLMVVGVLGTIVIIADFYIRIKSREFKWGFSESIYIAFIVFSILSLLLTNRGFGAINHPWYEREGPEHFLSYYWLFYACTRIKRKELKTKLLKVFILVCSINAIVSLMQSNGIGMNQILSCPPMYEGMNFSYGLTFNPNDYGGLSVVLLACSSGAFIFREKLTNRKNADIFLLILSMLLFYTSIASRARLALFGNVVVLMFYIISLALMRQKDIIMRFLVLVGSLLIVLLYAIFATDFIIANVQRTEFEVSNSEYSPGVGSGRLQIWRLSIDSIKDNFFFGIGLDNFDQIFIDYPNRVNAISRTLNAHNEYLNVFVCQGIFAFITYVSAMLYAVINSIKRIIATYDSKEAVINWIFLSMLVGYMAKALLGCSVIAVAPYLWTPLGLCFTDYYKQK